MRVIIFITLFFALLSCEQDRELIVIEQEADIDSYISSTYTENKIIRNNGSNRIIIDEGVSTTDSLELGDSLSFYYLGSVFNNRPAAAFATNLKYAADSIEFIVSNPDYSPIKVLYKEEILYKEAIFNNGLTNGLLGVKEGEHSIIIFSAKHGFNNESVYNIPKLSALIYEVWIDKIKKDN